MTSGLRLFAGLFAGPVQEYQKPKTKEYLTSFPDPSG
jgi:hypothetical protein